MTLFRAQIRHAGVAPSDVPYIKQSPRRRIMLRFCLLVLKAAASKLKLAISGLVSSKLPHSYSCAPAKWNREKTGKSEQRYDSVTEADIYGDS